jgi:hypothetical protein
MGLATRCNCDRPQPRLRQSMAPALENSTVLSMRQGQRSIRMISTRHGFYSGGSTILWRRSSANGDLVGGYSDRSPRLCIWCAIGC